MIQQLKKQRKRKAIEHRYVTVEEAAGDIDDLCTYQDICKKIEASILDKRELERFIYGLNAQESTMLLLKFLGYMPLEIVEIMHLKTINRYKRLDKQMRTHSIVFNKFRNKQKL